MSITPYEVLAVAPKSQEASFFKTAQLQKEEGQQTQIAGMVQQQAEQKMNRTGKAEEKDSTPFHYDAKEKGNNAYERQKKEQQKKKQEERENEARKRMLGCSFEVTV